MANDLKVLFMPAVDEDVSNYIHAVAPFNQHGNWLVSDGDEVAAGIDICNFEYKDVSGSKDGLIGFVISMFEKHPTASFSLKSPVNGRFHRKSGFYSQFASKQHDNRNHVDTVDLASEDADLSRVMYAFHVFIEGKPTVFPYDFYKPWFDCVRTNRSWIEGAIDHYYGEVAQKNFQALMRDHEERFKNVPCQIIPYESFKNLMRRYWGDNPNRPSWLN